MKFKVELAKRFYSLNNNYENNEVNKLQELGFKFVDTRFNNSKRLINDNEVEIEINTLDDLILFIKRYGKIVIDNNSIIIFNGNLE